jgi:hypothetical protein
MSKFVPISLILLVISACGPSVAPQQSSLQEAWNQENAPENMGVRADVHYDSLPRQAYLAGERAPWSGDYFATYQGGISNRWQYGFRGENYQAYVYEPLQSSQLAGLTEDQLAVLSPAEKIDLYLNRVNMPLARSEQQNMISTAANNGNSVPTWFGLCHGWAPAAYMEKEPLRPVSVGLSDGRQLRFEPSDLKALITYAYAHADVEAAFIGTRCEGSGRRNPFGGRRWANPNCRDTNAGAFHLAITEYIGQRQESLVAEMDRDKEVWNRPVIGYRFNYGRARGVGPLIRRRERMHPSAAFVVPVEMVLDYVVETAATAQPGTPAVKQRVLKYNIEITENGLIVGGRWLSQNQPDFLWRLTEKPRGELQGVTVELVRDLIERSRQ